MPSSRRATASSGRSSRAWAPSPVPGQAAKASGWPPLTARVGVDLGEDPVGRGAGHARRPRARRPRRPARRRCARRTASSTPVTSVVRCTSKRATRSTSPIWARKAWLAQATTSAAPRVERVGGGARAAEARDGVRARALADVRAGQRPERGDEALGAHEHAGALGDLARRAPRRSRAARAAVTARQMRSWWASAISPARCTAMASGSGAERRRAARRRASRGRPRGRRARARPRGWCPRRRRR